MQAKLQSSLEQMEGQLDECIYADEVYKEMVAHMAVGTHKSTLQSCHVTV